MTGACDVLVLGGTGLAGVAVVEAARARGLAVASAARRSGDIRIDIADAPALRRMLAEVAPRLIVNAAAMVSVAECERSPGDAWVVNARPAAILADHARGTGARLVHISTDHFYCGDGRRRHLEGEPVRLLNEYARSKYAAEAFALTHADTVVLRTNIVGLSSATGASFGEWALDVIREDRPATLFDDQYVSTLDVWAFAEALLDIAASDARGLVNLASCDVYSKAEFVSGLATALGATLTRARVGSVGEQAVPRPDSLGLDVSRARGILGREPPGMNAVIRALADRIELTKGRNDALAL